MKKDDWYKAPDDELIGNRKCIKNRVSKELCLSGKYGDIWQFKPNLLCCVITSTRIAKRYLPKEYHPINKDDESRHFFSPSKLSEWVFKLKVPKQRAAMLKYARKFGK